MSGSKPATGVEQIFGHIDPDAMKVVRRLLQAGHEAYLVGGCVRDLYLGRNPKDFDVATSATPEAIRKAFRNSRVIGRRFKLAHVFFGPKIIETSTFRTAPLQDDDDPLITHDNEWGTVEDDARRRDFTINGLFYDVESRKIVDFVDGMEDLDHGVVRTIGDPELRFREDPVRMIRAIKFAARLDFQIEPATWQALLDVAPDIVRSSRARLLEEIYKLMRSGASRRCFELLLEAGLLHRIMPDYTCQFGTQRGDDGLAALQAGLHPTAAPPPPAAAGDSSPEQDQDQDQEQDQDGDDEGGSEPRAAALLWRYLDALDDYIRETREDVVNGVLQAVLFAPLVAGEMIHGSRPQLDRAIERVMTPVGAAFGVARRDRELARQILMAHRRMTDQRKRRRRSSLAQRQYFHDALIFMGMSVRALGDDGSELSHWKTLATAQDEPPPAKGGGDGGGRKRTRRRRSGRRPKKADGDEREAATSHDG
jgi:poly(A) polymerase